jgi:hypothetical protein
MTRRSAWSRRMETTARTGTETARSAATARNAAANPLMRSQPPRESCCPHCSHPDPPGTLHVRGHLAHLPNPADDRLTLCGVWWRREVEPGTWPLCARCRALHRLHQRTPPA